MRVAFSTMEKIENRPVNSVGSSRIRARWLCNFWDQAQEYHVGEKYDVMIFQKAYWHEMLSKFEGIKIFDICDPDWLIPRPVVESAIMCDAVVTSTEALAEYLRKFIKDRPVICIPDRVNLDEHNPRGPHEGRARSVVWFGYQHNAHYLEKTYQFLIDKGLSLTVVADKPIDVPKQYEKLQLINIKYNYDTIHEELKKHDMVLLPNTSNDLKGEYKSNNKTLTAWALGMPVVSEPEDLDRFMDADSRNAERERVLKLIKEQWDVKLSVKEYQDLIEQIKKTKGVES